MDLAGDGVRCVSIILVSVPTSRGISPGGSGRGAGSAGTVKTSVRCSSMIVPASISTSRPTRYIRVVVIMGGSIGGSYSVMNG